MATNRPLPDQGRGIGKLYLVFDLVLLVLNVLLVISIMRMRRRYQRWKEQGITNWNVLFAIANFIVPALVLYLTTKVFFWRLLEMYQPDLYYWLNAVGIVLFVKGVIEIALISSVFRDRHRSQPQVS